MTASEYQPPREYQPPGWFADLADTPLAHQLWDFVNDPENLDEMAKASNRGQPAVVAIEKPLLDRFGAKVMPAQIRPRSRIKHMIGHMVRQAMEHQGFIHHEYGVEINSVLFSKGSLYRKA
ncbi:MAG: hypothetical protein GDA41_11840 [Rhodospirillales bacterium]|nr:hypothetical protein [Rhodospirillales bacterium]